MLTKNKSTPENRKFWRHVERVTHEVRKREFAKARMQYVCFKAVFVAELNRRLDALLRPGNL